MSWDVIVQNYGGNPPPADELMDGPKPEPLGAPATIRKKIDTHLPGVVWSDSRHGIFEGDGFSIEFAIGDEKPIDHIMLSVRGGGQAVGALVSFARPNRWSLFDLSESEFLDLETPSRAGFEAFQEYRDRALPKGAGRPKTASAAKTRGQPARKRTAKPKGKGKRKTD